MLFHFLYSFALILFDLVHLVHLGVSSEVVLTRTSWLCASLSAPSYHEASGPHRGQSGAVGSRVRCGVRSVRLRW